MDRDRRPDAHHRLGGCVLVDSRGTVNNRNEITLTVAAMKENMSVVQWLQSVTPRSI